MSASRLGTLVGGVILPLLLAACPAKEVFEHCATSQLVQADCKTAISEGSDQCSEAEVYCYDSCLVRDHPQCIEGPCVLYEGKGINEDKPTVSDDTSFCTMTCHGEACPADATCREVRSLKVDCKTDSECKRYAPWSRCEPQRFCQASGKTCEVGADCGRCLPLNRAAEVSGTCHNAEETVCHTDADCPVETCETRETAAKSCTYKFCIPTAFGPGA